MKMTEVKTGMKVAAFGIAPADTFFTGAENGDSGTVLVAIGEPLPRHENLKPESEGKISEYVYVILDKNGELLVLDETQSVVVLEGGN